VADHGDTLQLKRVHEDEGLTAVLFRNIPSEAHEALNYLADLATGLEQQLAEEIAAHNETRHALILSRTGVL